MVLLNEFDSQLNAAFAQFQADGITDLVLDLRYNGGGSVRTATYLAQMITGQFTNELFYSEQWNEDRQDGVFRRWTFSDCIFSGGEAINSLNFNRVYVLTTGRTASASELIINGLDPYITVKQVGGTTTGKFQASFLLYDAPAPGLVVVRQMKVTPTPCFLWYLKRRMPVGFTDFVDGLDPDIELAEDYSNLGMLGDANEPLLAEAFNDIFPSPIRRDKASTY